MKLRIVLFLSLALLAAGAPFVSVPLSDSARSEMLKTARALLTKPDPEKVEIAIPDSPGKGLRAILISLSRAKAPAIVESATAETSIDAFRKAAMGIRSKTTSSDISSGRIKIDVAVEFGKEAAFDSEGLAKIDRSLQGLWLPSAKLLLLPDELTSRKLVNTAGDLQSGALTPYLQEARGISVKGNPGKAGNRYSVVKFDSFMEGPVREMRALFRGNPTPSLEPSALLQACVSGGDYLVGHQRSSGLFNYSYEPKTDEDNDDYNELRHAGTAYALLELYAVTKDSRYKAAAERAIEAMFAWVRSDKEKNFETLVYEGEEAKLGGAALAALAILKYEAVTGDAKWRSHAVKFARFLLFQQEENGRFESKYFYGEPDEEPFESLYYPGEAILALTRLHAVDPKNTDWLKSASRGVDWLVQIRDAGKATAELPHDHWLLIALNELYPLTKNEQHLQHAERISTAILAAQRKSTPENPDWIGSFYDPPRSTPTATRAEAMVAMWQLAGKTGRRADVYLDALKKMALFQLRCQLTPENTLYLPRPDIALGGFRRSMDNWEVRIDYVQHNISSLLGLRQILLMGDKEATTRTQRH